MKITIDVRGMDVLRTRLVAQQKQVRFATAKALTQTAWAINKEIQEEMKQVIAGGPTAYTLRAFKVTGATRDNLQSVVSLRTDAPDGGTVYAKALAHLFSGGRRDWKKLEGWLKGKGMMPAGMMIAPGPKAPLDSRGNFRRTQINEMLGILSSNIRNLKSFRKTGAGKQQKGIGFFICRPGDNSGLTPGIWRRIETGNSSVVEPWIMYISPTSYRRKLDLEAIAKRTVARVFQSNFETALTDALRTAK